MKNIGSLFRERMDMFLKEVFCLSGEAQAAVEHQIPMTQELFEYCLDFYIDIDNQKRVMDLMKKYPQFLDAYVERIEEEISHTELPEETPEQAEALWKRICARIRAEYGEGAI